MGSWQHEGQIKRRPGSRTGCNIDTTVIMFITGSMSKPHRALFYCDFPLFVVEICCFAPLKRKFEPHYHYENRKNISIFIFGSHTPNNNIKLSHVEIRLFFMLMRNSHHYMSINGHCCRAFSGKKKKV